MLAQRCTSKSIPLKLPLQSHLRVHLSGSLWIALYHLSREYQVQITLRSFVFFLKETKKNHKNAPSSNLPESVKQSIFFAFFFFLINLLT